MNLTDRSLTVIATFSVLVSLLHGWVHATIPVTIAAWQLAVAGAVLLATPALGVALLATGHRLLARWTLLLAALAGFGFEGVLHFVVRNPDHVATVDHGAALFTSTALLSTGGDALLALAAGWLCWRQSQGSFSSSRIDSIR